MKNSYVVCQLLLQNKMQVDRRTDWQFILYNIVTVCNIFFIVIKIVSYTNVDCCLRLPNGCIIPHVTIHNSHIIQVTSTLFGAIIVNFIAAIRRQACNN